MKRLFSVMIAVAILTVTSSRASADLVPYELTWSGASFSNSATATALLIIDTSVFPTAQNDGEFASFSAADLGIVSLTLTVQGASSGNGTFTLADYTNSEAFGYWTGDEGVLNLSQQLVGQYIGDCNFWADPSNLGDNGDFNLFPDEESFAPGGDYFFTLGTNNDDGDLMLLTSFAPVPEPSAMAGLMAFIGLGALVLHRRRIVLA